MDADFVVQVGTSGASALADVADDVAAAPARRQSWALGEGWGDSLCSGYGRLQNKCPLVVSPILFAGLFAFRPAACARAFGREEPS